MPLLSVAHPFSGATFSLWQIAEQEDFFREDLPLSTAESAELDNLQHPVRRLEWLAGRWLLHKTTGAPQRLPLAKDAFSKPFFPENQHLACSLSHSRGCVGALVVTRDEQSESAPLTGCDIQMFTEKMTRIAPKFLRESEKNLLKTHPSGDHIALLHLFWTAKESLYKAYGLKALDFREHIRVDDIEWDGQGGQGRGAVEKAAFARNFQLFFGKTIPGEASLFWAICVET